jgi:hypothetical protein
MIFSINGAADWRASLGKRGPVGELCVVDFFGDLCTPSDSREIEVSEGDMGGEEPRAFHVQAHVRSAN